MYKSKPGKTQGKDENCSGAFPEPPFREGVADPGGPCRPFRRVTAGGTVVECRGECEGSLRCGTLQKRRRNTKRWRAADDPEIYSSEFEYRCCCVPR